MVFLKALIKFIGRERWVRRLNRARVGEQRWRPPNRHAIGMSDSEMARSQLKVKVYGWS